MFISLDEYPKIGVKILTGIGQILSRSLRRASGSLADCTLSGAGPSPDFRKMQITK